MASVTTTKTETEKTPVAAKAKAAVKTPAAAKAKAAVAKAAGAGAKGATSRKLAGSEIIMPDPKAPAFPTNAKTARAWIEHWGAEKKAIAEARKMAGYGEATEALIHSAGMSLAAADVIDPKGAAKNGAETPAPAKGKKAAAKDADESTGRGRKSLDLSGHKITVLSKDDLKARDGTLKHAIRKIIVAANGKKTDTVIGKTATAGDKSCEINSINIQNAVKAGVIKLD